MKSPPPIRFRPAKFSGHHFIYQLPWENNYDRYWIKAERAAQNYRRALLNHNPRRASYWNRQVAKYVKHL